MRRLILAAALWGAAWPLAAEEFTALARALSDGSGAVEQAGRAEVRLALDQAVPWRLRLADDPARVVLDLREADWRRLSPEAFTENTSISEVRWGRVDGGWSRLELLLASPHLVEAAEMRTDAENGAATVIFALVPTTAEAFAARVQPDREPVGPTPARVEEPWRRQGGDRPLVVVLDPGHGGSDPGAEHEGVREADLMLTFARELKEELLRSGRFGVVLTRDADVFVSLDSRVRTAREVGADVFLSLHADALAEGRAIGASVYTLSDTAADRASARMAANQDRTDLLAGLDLREQDDVIAEVLMDLARRDTDPRSDRLAEAIVAGIRSEAGRLHKRPRMSAGFTVLKAPDIPSALIELGFLSSERDRERLTSSDWRRRLARGIRVALDEWAVADAAEAAQLRR